MLNRLFTGNTMKLRALVSVIIPTHNRPEFLRKAVASVVVQTYRPIEIVIVDDASADPVRLNWFTDGLSDVSLSIYRNNISKGAAASRNLGIVNSKGGLIAFLDDDDQWMPDKLSLQTEALIKRKSVNFRAVFCQMIVKNENGMDVYRTNFPTSTEAIRRHILFGDGNLPPPTLLIEREVFEEIGFFNEQMPTFEDRQWALQYLHQYEIILVDEYLASIRHHANTRLTTNSKAMLAGELAYTAFIKQYLFSSHAKIFRKVVGYRYTKLGNEYLLSGQMMSGVKSFLTAIRYNPFGLRAWVGFVFGMCGPGLYRKIMASRMNRVRLAEKSSIFNTNL